MTIILWIALFGCTGDVETEGACVLYGEDTGGGRYGCQIRSAADCPEDATITYHDGETCQELGFTEDCRSDDYLYEPEWCP